MKQSFRIIAVILFILLAFSGFTQNKNSTATMKQDDSIVRSYDQQVNVIDKIGIPANAVTAYSEKSLYIRNILRQQTGFVKYEIFQQKDENGNLKVITIATWASQQALDNAKTAIQAAMQKAGINMPEFLKQQGITMERGVYQSVFE